MHIKVLWGAGEWVESLAQLPVQGPLPSRTVLVPNERVAHSLRRELVRGGRAGVLAGTRFVPLLAAAVEVLHAAGVEFTANEEALRPTRLRALFRTDVRLRYFDPASLRSRLGWDDAFARTIGHLEHAGLRPSDLKQPPGEDRLVDLAAIWQRLDEAAGGSWTSGHIFAEAAAVIEHGPDRWPFDGPALCAVSAEMSASQARFVRAIPGVTICVAAGRPVREHYLERLARLFGEECAAAVRDSVAPRRAETERGLLQSYLFERPDVLAAPERSRSGGPDGTVHLEEHAGIEAELEATADWVGRQIVEHGTPLEEIAVLMPALDPLAGMVVNRLERLPWQGGEMPVYVAGGLPVTGLTAGARALAVIRALGAHLSASHLAGILPALRAGNAERNHLSHGGAMDLVYSLGIIGGSINRPADALEWSARAEEKARELEAEIERARAAEGDEEQAGLARQLRDLERLLRDLRAIRPALRALVEVVGIALDDRPLVELWKPLYAFLESWLLAPGDGPRIPVLLDDALRPACGEAACRDLTGDEALVFIEERLCALRVQTGRFGDPAVYVGTVADAVGICFHAVRVIGLSEGTLPAAPGEDPVLPAEAYARMDNSPLPTAADRALAQLHALDRIVRDTSGAVILSAPRLTADRVEREASSVFIEAAAALGRPERSTGKPGKVIPDTRGLRRDAFAPARAETSAFRSSMPLSASAWQDRVASLRAGLPSSWRRHPELDLDRIETLVNCESWCGLDGLVGSAGPGPPLRGLTARAPASASRLRTLVECPHRFLFENVLSWGERATPPPLRDIEPLSYGSLFHGVAQDFFRTDGEAFGKRESTLARWLALADDIVARKFEEFCRSYPLGGAAVRGQQHKRLQRDFRTFLEYDWNDGRPRRFVAVERPFGQPDPLELDIDGEPIFLRGFIDRIDIEDGRTLLRDLKTGRSHPRAGREADPEPARDLQIAVYGMVTRKLAKKWDVPAKIAAAYAYADVRGDGERSFRDDFHALEEAARTWLATALGLLRERYFPRSPVSDDCRYCAFEPVCGGRAQARTLRLLQDSTGVLGDFLKMKVPEEG